jgi:hypothetical protein
LRIEFPGAVYHAISCGGWRETMITMGLVARRLRMGTRNSCNTKLLEWKKMHNEK